MLRWSAASLPACLTFHCCCHPHHCPHCSRCLTAAVLNNMRGKVGRHGQEAAIIGLDKLRAQAS